jgi:hypothetical protein
MSTAKRIIKDSKVTDFERESIQQEHRDMIVERRDMVEERRKMHNSRGNFE